MQEEWAKISRAVLKTLVESMTRRCVAVIRSQGKQIEVLTTVPIIMDHRNHEI